MLKIASKNALEIFKKDLGTFVRFYEFMSQICDYNDKDLEKLSLYARNLRPMLRESAIEEDEIDLSHVVLSHYRLSKTRQQDIQLKEDVAGYELEPGDAMGSAKAKDPKEEFLSQIVARLNELFITDDLTNADMLNFIITKKDKVMENERVMQQIKGNSPEQAMLGDFREAFLDAILTSDEAQKNLMMQLLSDPAKEERAARLVFDMITGGKV
jgi:type I restriction enzyme R subunit